MRDTMITANGFNWDAIPKHKQPNYVKQQEVREWERQNKQKRKEVKSKGGSTRFDKNYERLRRKLQKETGH